MRRYVPVFLAFAYLTGCPTASGPEPLDASPTEGPRAAKASVAPSPSLETVLTPIVAGDPARRLADRSAVEAGIAKLSVMVKSGAQDLTNPWAMAHGLAAFGAELKASDGRRAVDAIVADHLEDRTVGGRTVVGFPGRTAIREPVEPHPHLMAKAFAEAGVPLERRLGAGPRSTTLRKLLDDAAWTFSIPSDKAGWHEVAWALSAFAAHPPERGPLKTQLGPVSLEAAAVAALGRLEREQAFLAEPMRLRRPDAVQKRRQGIYGHNCGGLHFVQAVTRAAGLFPSLHTRIQRQLAAVRFRWAAERRLYRRLANEKPKYRPLLLIQELKFYGHVLETMALAVKWGVITADGALRREMRMVAADLLDTIRALEPLYGRLDRIRETTPQTYYDLVGDGCHAVRGLRESLVAFF